MGPCAGQEVGEVSPEARAAAVFQVCILSGYGLRDPRHAEVLGLV